MNDGVVILPPQSKGKAREIVGKKLGISGRSVEKGAKSLLLPVGCRRQLFDLSDEMATKLDIEFYQDARDALLKSLAE